VGPHRAVEPRGGGDERDDPAGVDLRGCDDRGGFGGDCGYREAGNLCGESGALAARVAGRFGLRLTVAGVDGYQRTKRHCQE